MQQTARMIVNSSSKLAINKIVTHLSSSASFMRGRGVDPRWDGGQVPINFWSGDGNNVDVPIQSFYCLFCAFVHMIL